MKVNKAICNIDGIATAKPNIEGNDSEELLKMSLELYESRVAEFGEEKEYTILAGKKSAIELQRVNRGEEARELLLKLLTTSKQVLGPHHNTASKGGCVSAHIIPKYAAFSFRQS